MHTFAEKPKTSPLIRSAPARPGFGPSREISSQPPLQRASDHHALPRPLKIGEKNSRGDSALAENAGLGHDFGQLSVNAKIGQYAPFSGAQTISLGEGEAIDSETIEMEGKHPVGEAEYPADFIGPLQPGDTRAVPHDFVGPLQPGVTRSSSFHPTITVVTPGTRRSDCGAYTYKVRWGIPASESRSAGWIVQKVTKQFKATDCAGNPVAPVPFDNPANYPFWEAWEFTAGQNVWVGHASGGSRHSGDTFSGSDYGPGTKGKKTVTGEVKAIVGFALPAGMTVRNAAPAWALPYTRKEPAQFANTLTGASHTLTSEWDCCPNGTVTQATKLTTNP